MQNYSKFDSMASSLQEALRKLDAKSIGGNQFIARCPCHQDKTPSLSVKALDSGDFLVHCFAGCHWQDVKRAMSGSTNSGVFSEKQEVPITREVNRSRRVLQIWNETQEVIDGDPVSNYLRHTRGLALDTIPADLRSHAELPYWRPKTTDNSDDFPFECIGKFAAMVAAFRSAAGDLIGIHRTFLTPEHGQLTIAPDGGLLKPKKWLSARNGATCGGAIRLGEPQNKLVLAEGIVTALAGSILSNSPAWAAGSATLLKAIILPSTVEEVVICIDNDPTSFESARHLAFRLKREGRKVFTAKPDLAKKGADWADFIGGTN